MREDKKSGENGGRDFYFFSRWEDFQFQTHTHTHTALALTHNHAHIYRHTQCFKSVAVVTELFFLFVLSVELCHCHISAVTSSCTHQSVNVHRPVVAHFFL